MVQGIAQKPDKVAVEEKTVDSQVDFYISCAPDDIGRIIGKKGKIIKALRRVLGIIAVKDGKRVTITMVDAAASPLSTQDESEDDSTENQPLGVSPRSEHVGVNTQGEPES